MNYLIWVKWSGTQVVGLAWQVFYPLRHHPGPVMIFPKGLKDATFGDKMRKTIDKDKVFEWRRNYLF